MRKVLFVCVGNVSRSQMAEAFFNHMASRGMTAISAGIKPADRISLNAVRVMEEVGINIVDKKPKRLTEYLIRDADKVVTMGCGAEVCPAPFLPKVEDWGIEDPSGKSLAKFREVRDRIRVQVERLLEEMRSRCFAVERRC